jgi:uncharacterized protein YbbK (DUF523 family)
MKVTSIINGVKFNLSEGLEIDIDSNGAVNISKRSDVKQVLFEDNNDLFGSLKESTEEILGGLNHGDIAKAINETNFPSVGVTRQMQANSEHSIRSAMAKYGFGAHVKRLKRNLFMVTRTVKMAKHKPL